MAAPLFAGYTRRHTLEKRDYVEYTQILDRVVARTNNEEDPTAVDLAVGTGSARFSVFGETLQTSVYAAYQREFWSQSRSLATDLLSCSVDARRQYRTGTTERLNRAETDYGLTHQNVEAVYIFIRMRMGAATDPAERAYWDRVRTEAETINASMGVDTTGVPNVTRVCLLEAFYIYFTYRQLGCRSIHSTTRKLTPILC